MSHPTATIVVTVLFGIGTTASFFSFLAFCGLAFVGHRRLAIEGVILAVVGATCLWAAVRISRRHRTFLDGKNAVTNRASGQME